MPFITLGGVQCNVVEDSFIERTPIYQGGRERMRAGNTISTEDTPMRVWDFQIDVDTDVEEAAIRAACPRGTPVQWLIGTEDLVAVIDFGDVTWFQYYNETGYAIYKRIPVHVEQTVLV